MADTTDVEIELGVITFTELEGLQLLASVARCCQTHALSAEVQAALSWITDVEESGRLLLKVATPVPELAFECRINDPSGISVACGTTEAEARSVARARFIEDVGRPPSEQATIQVKPRQSV